MSNARNIASIAGEDVLNASNEIVPVYADSTLDVLNKSIYLEEGDSLRLTASAASDLEGICSYEEISE